MSTSQSIATDHPLNAAEQSTLRTLAGLIIPPSAEYQVPGANDDLIFQDLLQQTRADIAAVQSGIQFAQDVTIDQEQPLDTSAIAILQGKPELAVIVSMVAQVYYRDDRVMQSIGMEPRPPFPQGYEVPQGDWSMLEPVQQRGKIWRDA